MIQCARLFLSEGKMSLCKIDAAMILTDLLISCLSYGASEHAKEINQLREMVIGSCTKGERMYAQAKIVE